MVKQYLIFLYLLLLLVTMQDNVRLKLFNSHHIHPSIHSPHRNGEPGGCMGAAMVTAVGVPRHQIQVNRQRREIDAHAANRDLCGSNSADDSTRNKEEMILFLAELCFQSTNFLKKKFFEIYSCIGRNIR